tara:strand:- start:5111 stop:6259 length:1149 start_codon:yes stop_codon:yes gene_type:complete
MGTQVSIIETGVDKLVKLVKEKGRISFSDAAKALDISQTIIQEWSEFLEEEGILSTDYKLTKPYLVDRKISKKQVQTKAKEFVNKKDLFVKRAETSLGLLEKQGEYLKSLKSEFDKLSDKFQFEMKSVQSELNELGKYDELRQNLKKEVKDQKEESGQTIGKFEENLIKEHEELQKIIDEVVHEEQEIEVERKKAISVGEMEKEVYKKVEDLKVLLASVEHQAKVKDSGLKTVLENFDQLNEKLIRIKNQVESQKSEVDDTLKKRDERQKRIQELQATILQKIRSNEDSMKDARGIGDKIKTIFDKKQSSTDIFETLSSNKEELEHDLKDLIKKAKAFQLSSKSQTVGKDVIQLEKKFDQVEKKKNVFDSMYKKLVNLTKSK